MVNSEKAPDRSFSSLPLPCHEAAEVALWRDLPGKGLRPLPTTSEGPRHPANGHLSEPSQKQISLVNLQMLDDSLAATS